MSRPFVVFDIDGTLIRWQLFHAMADALAKQGYLDPDDYKAIRDARMQWKRREHVESFKEYELQLVKVYETMLSTLTVDQFNQAARTVITEYQDQVYTYPRGLIRSLKEKDYAILAISGTQQEIIQQVTDHYGFDDCVGSIYEQDEGRFTGVKQVALGRKDKVLKELVAKHKLRWQDSVAVGDSAGDISMLELVDKPIAFNPDKALFEHAKSKGWQIVIERKNVVYDLEAQHGSYLLV